MLFSLDICILAKFLLIFQRILRKTYDSKILAVHYYFHLIFLKNIQLHLFKLLFLFTQKLLDVLLAFVKFCNVLIQKQFIFLFDLQALVMLILDLKNIFFMRIERFLRNILWNILIHCNQFRSYYLGITRNSLISALYKLIDFVLIWLKLHCSTETTFQIVLLVSVDLQWTFYLFWGFLYWINFFFCYTYYFNHIFNVSLYFINFLWGFYTFLQALLRWICSVSDCIFFFSNFQRYFLLQFYIEFFQTTLINYLILLI